MKCISSLKELPVLAHPYYGLKDGKGWLTRYPNTVDSYGNKLISRSWMEEFINLGGSIDGCGVWGIDPTDSWVEVQTPASIVNLLNLEHNHRWDNISRDVRLVSQAGLIISDDINWACWKALSSGQSCQNICQLAGITTNLTVMQLGWMKTSKWKNFVAQNATKYPASPNSYYGKNSIAYGDFFGVSLQDVGEISYVAGFDDSNITNPVWWKAKHDYLKFKQRREIHGQVPHISPALLSLKVLARLLQIDRIERPEWKGGNPRKCRKTAIFQTLNTSVQRRTTTAGSIWYSGNLLMQESANSFKPLKVRKVGLHNIASATYGTEHKKVIFAWLDNDFLHHAEGSSVREAISKLEGRTKIKGLKMSLNDIKTNSSFCFAGVKNFLADKMKHIYNLVSGFSYWEDVPEEILNIEWDLVSRKIFMGYPEP